jgi:hypothetical protein
MLQEKHNTKENIQKWQEFLRKLGHNVQPNGEMDLLTIKATRMFQGGQQIPENEVGPKTIKAATTFGFEGLKTVKKKKAKS